MSMDKFGVDEGVDQEKLEKQASDGCPICGRKDLTKHGSLLFCPVHGSEPFETERKR
jgi:RNA polymerase subunit RPABC4/transcription elongation factor Spt4